MFIDRLVSFPGSTTCRCALLLCVLLLTGCNLTQLTAVSSVVRVRVAGIEAEPAEIALGESTTLQALLVYPEAPPPEWGQVWFACAETEGASSCLSQDPAALLGGAGGAGGSDDDFDPADIQFGVGPSFVYTAQGPSLEEAWQNLDPEDRVEGLGAFVAVSFVQKTNEELEELLTQFFIAFQSDDQETTTALSQELGSLLEDGVLASRRVVISDKSADEPDPTDCAVTELLPNRNPEFDRVLLHLDAEGQDEGFALGPVTFAEPGATLVLRPQLGAESTEDYLYITTDGDTECRRETPYIAWLTNGGSLEADYSFIAEEGDLEEVAGRPKVNRLTLPERERLELGVDLWLVLRDRRGGLVWEHRRFLPLEP